MRRWIVLSFVLAGCYTAPGQGQPSSTTAVPKPYVFPRGIYRVTPFVERDTCTPPSGVPPVADLGVEILDGGSANVPIIPLEPGISGPFLFLERWDADGAARQTDSIVGACGAHRVSTWAIVDQGPTSFDEIAQDTWRDVEPCADGGGVALPDQDCEGDVSFHFELLQRCPEGCALVPDAQALQQLTYRDLCSCDGG